jgi:4'-phosphopantetheinyl transferase
VVHVLQVDLTHGDVHARVLSSDERERAARMKDPGNWIAARAALRIALGTRLRSDPAGLTFAASPHGKPELPGHPVRFNLAHSADRALIALSDDREVGVDLERLARSSRAVERTLTDGERAGLPPGDRHTELMRVWCRKEALAKAIGTGLGWTPENFDTSRPDGYSIVDLAVDDGYLGALAVAGERPDVVVAKLEL